MLGRWNNFRSLLGAKRSVIRVVEPRQPRDLLEIGGRGEDEQVKVFWYGP